MARFEGEVALVTGGSSGIGAAIARRLAGDGARVVVSHEHDEVAAHAVVAAIEANNGHAIAIAADLRSIEEIRGLVQEAVRLCGRLDILVNNAGVYVRRQLGAVDDEHVRHHFDVNVRAALFAAQEVLPHLDRGGRIISISSGLARLLTPTCSVYAASKAALEALTRCLAAELGPRGITVNAVAPGIVETAMLRRNLDEEAKAALVQSTALRRVGTPEDIAAVVAFLASDDARWITGQVIDVDGGLNG
jgi:3-oxoacyl-[acyl-carrier protein] reductase